MSRWNLSSRAEELWLVIENPFECTKSQGEGVDCSRGGDGHRWENYKNSEDNNLMAIGVNVGVGVGVRLIFGPIMPVRFTANIITIRVITTTITAMIRNMLIVGL